MVPYDGLRHPKEQGKLWRQSRSRQAVEAKIAELKDAGALFLADCIESVGPQSGKHVTDAIPGNSWHQYAEAVDCYWSVNGNAEWSAETIIDGKNGYQVYADEAEALGLTAGGRWPRLRDWPHVQSQNASSPLGMYTLAQIESIMKERFGPESIRLEGTGHVLGTLMVEGYTCVVYEDDSGRVSFTADADIDADGANGQNGLPVAYKVDDGGTEALANGGMVIRDGKVVCKFEWARHVVILGADNEPRVFPGGVIASMTAYKYPGKRSDDPSAYVDSELVPYIVVPPLVRQRTEGKVLGCKARVSWNGKSVDCVVADTGPKDAVGEVSIAAARALGFRSSSPRNGGRQIPDVYYELWPGVPAPGFHLV